MSEYLFTLSEMSYFYDLEKYGTSGITMMILQGSGIQLFETHKTVTVTGKPE
jgi:hypothetical protein